MLVPVSQLAAVPTSACADSTRSGCLPGNACVSDDLGPRWGAMHLQLWVCEAKPAADYWLGCTMWKCPHLMTCDGDTGFNSRTTGSPMGLVVYWTSLRLLGCCEQSGRTRAYAELLPLSTHAAAATKPSSLWVPHGHQLPSHTAGAAQLKLLPLLPLPPPCVPYTAPCYGIVSNSFSKE